MPQRLFLETNSFGQTKKIAGFLAKEILAGRITSRVKNALVLALAGDLGSGKTTFAQGFLRAAGVRKKITSPTFVLIKNYPLVNCRLLNYRSIYHIDCYRVKNSKELLGLGLKEILNNPENIVLIEWPERIFAFSEKRFLPKQSLGLPENLIWIKFEHGKKINKRTLKFK